RVPGTFRSARCASTVGRNSATPLHFFLSHFPSPRGRSGEMGGLHPMSEVSRSGGGPARHLKKESWY
ncbi:MAG: hypothetical protein ACE5MM_04250, partial [Nitrospiraceae bacterium]